jgi:DNA-binding transcriptional ArsR family regulator
MTMEQPPVPLRDAAVMRAVAHPARLAILEHLGLGDPATATECAELVGLTPSATSYHLRSLARAGLIEKAPSRGDGREVVWQSRSRGIMVDGGPEPDPDVRAARRELSEAVLVRWETQIRQYLTRFDDEPPEWGSAAVLSQSLLAITAEELTDLNAKIEALIAGYRKRDRVDPPPGARTVSAQVRVFPVDRPL